MPSRSFAQKRRFRKLPGLFEYKNPQLSPIPKTPLNAPREQLYGRKSFAAVARAVTELA